MPLFAGTTEYSVHWDASIEKYVQVQSLGFGPASMGVRLANRPEGPWTDLRIFFKPDYRGIESPMMYSAKAHPELNNTGGVFVTFNVNSGDFGYLVKDQSIYFPKFLTLKIKSRKEQTNL